MGEVVEASPDLGGFVDRYPEQNGTDLRNVTKGRYSESR